MRYIVKTDKHRNRNVQMLSWQNIPMYISKSEKIESNIVFLWKHSPYFLCSNDAAVVQIMIFEILLKYHMFSNTCNFYDIWTLICGNTDFYFSNIFYGESLSRGFFRNSDVLKLFFFFSSIKVIWLYELIIIYWIE